MDANPWRPGWPLNLHGAGQFLFTATLEQLANFPRKHHWMGELSSCLPAPFKKYDRLQPTQILTLALHYLGGPPPKQPPFRFFGLEFDAQGDIKTTHYLKFPEFVPERDSGLGQLHPEMSVPEVLNLVGCPDEITPFSERDPSGLIYHWGEIWEYYQASCFDDMWAAVCLTWEPESRGTRMRCLQTRCYSRQDILDRVTGLIYGHSSLIHRIIKIQPACL